MGRDGSTHLGGPKFLSEQHSKAIGTYVGSPDNAEEGHHQKAAVLPAPAHYIIGKGYGEGDIQKAGENDTCFQELGRVITREPFVE